MNLVEIKVSLDAQNVEHVAALNNFLTVIGGKTAEAPPIEKPKRTRKPKKVEEPKVGEEDQETADKTFVKDVEEIPNGPGPKKQEGPTIEEVRALVSQKAVNNRKAIKEKLTELEAANVTNLDKKHYGAFSEFLNGLD